MYDIQGSPPRMRGKLLQDAMTKCQFRITPADAGKTKRLSPHPAWRQDHPRGCGENIITGSSTSISPGSPPRMRGKPNPLSKPQVNHRITPADAGKTYFKNNAKTLDEDHPRGCGENPPELSQMNTNIGSPPRMRGKLSSYTRFCRRTGITPADAGKTCRMPP